MGSIRDLKKKPKRRGPYVRLTELGRAFASQLRFPEEVEDALEEMWHIERQYEWCIWNYHITTA